MTTITAPPSTATTPAQVTSSRLRVALSTFLIAAMGLSTVSAIVSWWADDAIYDPDILIAAFGDLPNNPVRAERLGEWIASETMEGLAIEERLSTALPLGLSLFSGPLTDGIEQAASTASSGLIQTEFFAGIWEDALLLGHSTLIDALEGTGDGVLRADNGVLEVDISLAILAVYEQVIDRLPDIAGNGLVSRITGLETGELEAVVDGWVLENLPPDLGTFVLLESDALASLQEWKTGLGRLTNLSVLAALLCAAGALLITPRLRRSLLAIGIVAAGAVVIGVVAITGVERAVINALQDLPFDGEGFDPGAVLRMWWLGIVTFILVAIGAGAAGWIVRWRQAGVSPLPPVTPLP